MNLARRGAAGLLFLVVAAACGEPSPRRANEPHRVIAIAPSAVELLFVLGYGERVVGVGDYVAWPPETEALPRLGGLYDPRYEEIVRLEPDLALLLPSEQTVAERLRALGVEVLVIESETIADIERSFALVAKRFGEVQRGREVASEWRRALAPRPPFGLSAALVVDRRAGELGDLLVAGPRTFLDELLGLLGVVNSFADAPTRYPQVSLEEIIRRRPQAIVELRSGKSAADEEAALAADWSVLPAAEEICHLVIAGDYVLLPGPRIPELYRRLAEELARCGQQ